MDIQLVDRIANSIMYEGYMLYPYRPSSLKNRYRWTFGVVPPQPDAPMQTECLVVGDSLMSIDATIRFLQVVARIISEFCDGDLGLRIVDSLQVGDQTHYTWQEAVERDVTASVKVADVLNRPHRQAFRFPSNRETTTLCDEKGNEIGCIVREQRCIDGELVISAERCVDECLKLTVRICNHTTIGQQEMNDRDEQIQRSLVSTHTILGVRDGEFLSLLDPPAAFVDAVAECRNIGTWPVLVGEPNTRDFMLSSPIILYDYPRIAPESPGDLFDATEIDELLALRVNTLTDKEKHEAIAADAHVRTILARTDSLATERLYHLHGAIRDRPAIQTVKVGDHVRLRPRGRADAFDLLLEGKMARVESIERTLDGDDYYAVTVDDDPGQDLGSAKMIGHRFFFRPEEVELDRTRERRP